MKKLVFLLTIAASMGSNLFAQPISTFADQLGNIPVNYKAFVLVNKYGYAMSPDPVKFDQAKPGPGMILLASRDLGELIYGGQGHKHRLFNLILDDGVANRALFVPADDNANLVFSEMKFVQLPTKLQWMLHPGEDSRYFTIISAYDRGVYAGTDRRGALIQSRKPDDGFVWELIRVK